jgi:hypothetical protein
MTCTRLTLHVQTQEWQSERSYTLWLAYVHSVAYLAARMHVDGWMDGMIRTGCEREGNRLVRLAHRLLTNQGWSSLPPSPINFLREINEFFFGFGTTSKNDFGPQSIASSHCHKYLHPKLTCHATNKRKSVWQSIGKSCIKELFYKSRKKKFPNSTPKSLNIISLSSSCVMK